MTLEELQQYSDLDNVVVLFGFPYDEGTIRNKGRAGGEKGYEQVMTVFRKKLNLRPLNSKVLHAGCVPKNLTLEDAHEYLY